MDGITEKIHMKYLEEEIVKMQKTAKGLEKMIDKKDPKKDKDLIDMLNKMHNTTLRNIKNKEKELKNLYNKKIDTNNN